MVCLDNWLARGGGPGGSRVLQRVGTGKALEIDGDLEKDGSLEHDKDKLFTETDKEFHATGSDEKNNAKLNDVASKRVVSAADKRGATVYLQWMDRNKFDGIDPEMLPLFLRDRPKQSSLRVGR